MTTESEMKKHKENKHSDEQKQTIFLCICEKEFTVKRQLEKHMSQEHRREEDLKCDKFDYT